MSLSDDELTKIIERWDPGSWERHERAFVRQWMRQANDDIACLIEEIRELRSELAKRNQDEKFEQRQWQFERRQQEFEQRQDARDEKDKDGGDGARQQERQRH